MHTQPDVPSINSCFQVILGFFLSFSTSMAPSLFPPLHPPRTLALLLQCEPEINRVALMEVPAAVGCADTRTHTHPETLTSVQLSQPIGHHIGCSVEQRIGIIYSLLKKKIMVPCISLSPGEPG